MIGTERLMADEILDLLKFEQKEKSNSLPLY